MEKSLGDRKPNWSLYHVSLLHLKEKHHEHLSPCLASIKYEHETTNADTEKINIMKKFLMSSINHKCIM